MKQSEYLLNQVSIEQDTTVIKSNPEEEEEEVKQVEQEESNTVVEQNWPNPPESNQTNAQDLDLKSLLVQMTQALRVQNEEIENLKKQQANAHVQLKSHLDQSLKQYQNDEQKVGVILQQTINNSLMPKLEKLVKEEVNKSVQCQIGTRLLDPLREQLSRDMAEKFKSMENVLKDNVGKLFKSKTTIDTMSQSISNSMQGVIVNSYRETFQKLIVPNFEKACQNMYQQVNSSFAKGT